MNDEAVYRTAPATQGLLNMWFRCSGHGIQCIDYVLFSDENMDRYAV